MPLQDTFKQPHVARPSTGCRALQNVNNRWCPINWGSGRAQSPRNQPPLIGSCNQEVAARGSGGTSTTAPKRGKGKLGLQVKACLKSVLLPLCNEGDEQVETGNATATQRSNRSHQAQGASRTSSTCRCRRVTCCNPSCTLLCRRKSVARRQRCQQNPKNLAPGK